MQIHKSFKQLASVAIFTVGAGGAFATAFAGAQTDQAAQTINAAEVTKESTADSAARNAIVERLSALQSLRGQFTQTLQAKDGKQLQETTGDFTFKRPGLYHWESSEPFPQVVVGNGETVWVYDPDLEQVTITKQDAMPYNPANLLSGGIADLATRYHIEQFTDKEQERFTLTPLDTANAPFVQLGMHFAGGVLQAATLTDRLGQVTRITLQKTTVNAAVNDSLFSFEPPQGTDILMND